MFEDRTLRTQIVARSAIERYLARAAAQVPYVKGATIATSSVATWAAATNGSPLPD